MIPLQTLEDVESGREASQWLDPKDGAVYVSDYEGEDNRDESAK